MPGHAFPFRDGPLRDFRPIKRDFDLIEQLRGQYTAFKWLMLQQFQRQFQCYLKREFQSVIRETQSCSLTKKRVDELVQDETQTCTQPLAAARKNGSTDFVERAGTVRSVPGAIGCDRAWSGLTFNDPARGLDKVDDDDEASHDQSRYRDRCLEPRSDRDGPDSSS